MDLRTEAAGSYTESEWQDRYGKRMQAFRSVYTYYTLRKAA
jgi:hypothetical protein